MAKTTGKTGGSGKSKKRKRLEHLEGMPHAQRELLADAQMRKKYGKDWRIKSNAGSKGKYTTPGILHSQKLQKKVEEEYKKAGKLRNFAGVHDFSTYSVDSQGKVKRGKKIEPYYINPLSSKKKASRRRADDIVKTVRGESSKKRKKNK